MNVTFDTNVFVSGLTRPPFWTCKALANIVTGQDHLFVSQFIVDELKRVLAEKIGWTAEDITEVSIWLAIHARVVSPPETLHILADEPDNRILECALAADADLIVTGDRAMLALESIRNTRIVSLADYLGAVDNSLTSG